MGQQADTTASSTQGTTSKAVGPTGARQLTGDSIATSTLMCPTRASGPPPLFQHQVNVAQCQSKQRGLYHKCFTCVHANGRP